MRKIITLIITAVLCLTLAGCDIEFTESQYNSDKLIAQNGDNGLSKMSVMTTKNNNLTFTVEEFKGTKTLWTREYISGGEAAVDVKFTLGAGKAKLVHINANGEVVTIAECTPETGIERSAEFIVTMTKGKNRLKLVGCDVENLELEISIRQ